LLVALGLAAGSVVSLTLGRLVRGFLYRIAPEDPSVTAIAAVVLMTAALVAAWIPARRASRVDPMVALRHD
jgi:ABC-type antimicrobial peptide transport system permease subunit